MKSSFKTALLAATAALAVAFGAAAAHAGDFDDYLAAQQAASALDEMTGGDDILSQAAEAAASEDVLETLSDAVEAITEE